MFGNIQLIRFLESCLIQNSRYIDKIDSGNVAFDCRARALPVVLCLYVELQWIQLIGYGRCIAYGALKRSYRGGAHGGN